MKNYRKHIDDFFREKLGAYSETPPPEVWDDLEKRLDGLTTVTPNYPYRRLWHFAIVSALLLLGISVARKISDSPVSKNADIALNGKTISKAGASSANASSKPTAGNNVKEISSPGNAEQNTPGQTAENKNDNAPDNENVNNAASTSSANKTQHNSQHNYYSSKTQKNTNDHKTKATRTSEASNQKNNYASNYNSKSAKHGPSADDVNDNNQEPASPNATLSNNPKAVATESQSKKEVATVKKDAASKPVVKAVVKKDDKKRTHSDFARFEAGVKIGYEGGVSNGAANKLAVAPYLQYNVSKKFSLMVQPAVKAAYVSSKNIGDPQSYYMLNDDSKGTANDNVVPNYTGGAAVVDTHNTKYTLTQTHTSIVKSNTFGGTYAEVELPILLKYNICKKMSVYGGLNLVYSKLMGVTEHTSTKTGVLSSMDTTIVTVNSDPTPITTVPNGIHINYTGSNISEYKGPAYPGTPASQIRAGYMLGFSYACSKKWLFDALMEQTPAKTEIKGGYNTNTPLSSTYFRLSIGYKLTK